MSQQRGRPRAGDPIGEEDRKTPVAAPQEGADGWDRIPGPAEAAAYLRQAMAGNLTPAMFEGRTLPAAPSPEAPRVPIRGNSGDRPAEEAEAEVRRTVAAMAAGVGREARLAAYGPRRRSQAELLGQVE